MFKRKVYGGVNFIDLPNLHEIDIAQRYPGVHGYMLDTVSMVREDGVDVTLNRQAKIIIDKLFEANRGLVIISRSNNPEFINAIADEMEWELRPSESTPPEPTSPITKEVILDGVKQLELPTKQVAYIGYTAMLDARESVIAADIGNAIHWLPPTE